MACRVCGLVQEDPPWGESGTDPSHDICACCGIEFGYEDATPVGAHRARARWRSAGYRWWSPEQRPQGWGPEEQLRRVPPEYA